MWGTERIFMLACGMETVSLSQLSGPLEKQEVFRQLRRNQGTSTSLNPAPSEALRLPVTHSGADAF